ncbi:MAG: glycoside hydrolase family 3 N-terminal domain-containing protein [Jatrophihabitantaceae bacterium]
MTVSPATAAQTPAALARAAYARMTPRERVGQLFVIGIDAHGATAAQLVQLHDGRAGSVYLRGRTTDGRAAVSAVVTALRPTVTYAGVGPFVGTDQEGGEVQVLQGPGFDRMPTGLVQGRQTRAQLYANAARWGTQLRAAGVNVDLAPVADTVPANVGTRNQPIGRYFREFGSDVIRVRQHVAAFVNGMRSSHVATTVKHFPGLGRASGNTDTAGGVTDPTGPRDPFLTPFSVGIADGTDFVMVSSAVYPRIDPNHHACFSPGVIGRLLRRQLHFGGIVVSDSFGATAVAYLPAGTRAVRFFGAGGTMVLDSDPAQLAPMATTVLAQTGRSPAFANLIKADVLRVLTAKAGAGLIS